jgi:glycosyltransferase involved in cell wall biosynthesis
MPGALITVIVLTRDEERNLPDCLASLCGLEAEVWLVDSGSTDRTLEIARAAGCRIVEHAWENYAKQRNWAFDHLPIATPWTLCLDADERLTPELAAEIAALVTRDDVAEDGFILRKRTIFMGRWLRWGGQYPAHHLRLFRTGKARCEDRLYDQHFVVDGQLGELRNDYIDIITDSLTTWIERHNRWATLEAQEMMHGKLERAQVEPRMFGTPIERKRFLRMLVYRRTPLFVRPFLLFIFDYVIRLGFLDGVPGLIFHTLQRFWFRFLIDAKLWEAQRSGRALATAPVPTSGRPSDA